MREAIAGLEIEIEKNNVKISLDELPVIRAVPGLMRQLFHNLISNAIKFRKTTVNPTVEIRAEKMNGDGYCHIAVTDNGIGFNPKYAHDIFRVFKRLHSYHEFQGSGVGLSICKKIIEKHNGSISATSVPGEGSTFMIRLPGIQSVH